MVLTVCTQSEIRIFQTLSDKNTLEVKNFDTQLVFICNTFNKKPNISMKPQNADF